MSARFRPTSAYTLTELLIVVAIIAVLARIAVPKFADLLLRSKEAGLKSRLTTLRGALSIYYADTNEHPTDLEPALTSNARYLRDIPDGAVPAVLIQNNPGHSTRTGVATTLDEFATGAWTYLLMPPDDAWIGVNCTHKDSIGVSWSTR